MSLPAKQIAVTGAARQICYSLLFRFANGDFFGPAQPIILQLLSLPQAPPAMHGEIQISRHAKTAHGTESCCKNGGRP
ncbi:hypothetical protein [Bradyrhizobium genosp. P]|uniref:hypothetical protein n=1 Tax=Bradyrhizobium genosp. P TaxID=83641 RepID=UPI003CEE6AA6